MRKAFAELVDVAALKYWGLSLAQESMVEGVAAAGRKDVRVGGKDGISTVLCKQVLSAIIAMRVVLLHCVCKSSGWVGGVICIVKEQKASAATKNY